MIERYIAGESIVALAADLGVCDKTIRLKLSRAGITIRDTAESVIPSFPQLIAAYRGGESLKSISDRIGFSRGAIGRRFAMAAPPLRSQSDSERVKWRIIKQSDAGITRQLSKAWNARSGKGDPLSSKIPPKWNTIFEANSSRPSEPCWISN